MRRRDLLPLVATLLAASPLAAGAQQPRVPVVGFLAIAARGQSPAWQDAWLRAMGEAGFVEGRTFIVEHRSAEGDASRFPALAADLVARRVDVLMTANGPAAAAAMRATKTIPIVFAHVTDPVGIGLVGSLNRPGGNVTGIAASFEGLAEKRLQLLHELVPAATRIGYLAAEHTAPFSRRELELLTDAGKALGTEVILLPARKAEEIEPALDAGRRAGIGAVVIQAHVFFYAEEKRLLELLARHALPAAHQFDFAARGGLLRYGPDFDDFGYQAGAYVSRVLKGAKPADLPVMQPTKLKLVINMKTANAIGLTVPPTLLARTDEVIE
jgi:putative tryptophan/tyrosine transport system substrate-binding protein